MTELTSEYILSLSPGEELDALVAEKVMGESEDEIYWAPLLKWPGRYIYRGTLKSDDEHDDWKKAQARGEWEYCGSEYSRDEDLIKPILDRMISLGWLPLLDYYPSKGGWIVAMGRKVGDPSVTSMNLLEAVCKCSLLAVGV